MVIRQFGFNYVAKWYNLIVSIYRCVSVRLSPGCHRLILILCNVGISLTWLGYWFIHGGVVLLQGHGKLRNMMVPHSAMYLSPGRTLSNHPSGNLLGHDEVLDYRALTLVQPRDEFHCENRGRYLQGNVSQIPPQSVRGGRSH